MGRMMWQQRGALFGLDARIALAIFSLISVVAGATMVLGLDTIRAKSLSAELSDTGRAVEALHNDLKLDVYQLLVTPSARNAFAALYDKVVLEEAVQAGWSGPYIKFGSNQNPRYGTMALAKRGENLGEDCTPEVTCFLWVVYGSVKPAIAAETNDILDGDKEDSPNSQGRLQWSAGEGGNVVLGYRAAKALSPLLGTE